MSNSTESSSGPAAPRLPRAVGVGVRPAAALAVEVQVQGLVAGFDPEVVGARDAMDLVRVFADIEHAASAGLALSGLAARRVAETNLWERGGHRSAAHWLANTTGMSIGEAVRLLQTAEAAEKAPVTMQALKDGQLSTREAHAAGRAEAAEPQRGGELVRRPIEGNESVRELEQESSRIVNAASGESEAARTERIRKARAFRTGSNGDGASWAHIVGPTADLARLEAAMRPLLNDIFIDAREEGRREPHEAYAYDALMGLAERAASKVTTTENTSDDWEFAKVIVRADLAALDRGHPQPGEVCEIAGQGPIPVADVWRMIDGGAFIAGILTEGPDIAKVLHLGRRPTVLQRTILGGDEPGRPPTELDETGPEAPASGPPPDQPGLFDTG